MFQAQPSFGRFVKTGDAVEHRGFACPVRADQSGNLAFTDIEAQVVDRHKATETHGQMFDFQQRSCHQPCPS